jgi:hypothetical protein
MTALSAGVVAANAACQLLAVFVDLKDDQVRGEIFSTLQHLDSVINDVFDHIAKRVSGSLHLPRHNHRN